MYRNDIDKTYDMYFAISYPDSILILHFKE